MREKYTFNFGHEKQVMTKGYYETREHLVLKVLAYLYFNKTPKIETRITKSYKYKPDLVIDEDGQVKLWVECGKVSIKKLKKISRDFSSARIYVFRQNMNSAEALASQFKNRGGNPSGVNFVSFENDFVECVAGNLTKVNHIDYKKAENNINITINGNELVSKINSTLP